MDARSEVVKQIVPLVSSFGISHDTKYLQYLLRILSSKLGTNLTEGDEFILSQQSQKRSMIHSYLINNTVSFEVRWFRKGSKVYSTDFETTTKEPIEKSLGDSLRIVQFSQ
jgi:hypothetical protein